MSEVRNFAEPSPYPLLERYASSGRPVHIRIWLQGVSAELTPFVELWLGAGRLLAASAPELAALNPLVLVVLGGSGRVEEGIAELPALPPEAFPEFSRAYAEAEEEARALLMAGWPLGGLCCRPIADIERVRAHWQLLPDDVRTVLLLADGSRSLAQILREWGQPALTAAAILERLQADHVLASGQSAATRRDADSLPSTAGWDGGEVDRTLVDRTLVDRTLVDRTLVDLPRVAAPSTESSLEVVTDDAEVSRAAPRAAPFSEVEDGSLVRAAMGDRRRWLYVAAAFVLAVVAWAGYENERSGQDANAQLTVAAPPAVVMPPPQIAPPPPPPAPIAMVELPARPAATRASKRYSLANPPPVAGPDADARLREAEHLLRSGRLDEAAPLLEKLRRELPRDAAVWVVSGILEDDRGNSSEAKKYVTRALREDRRHYRAWILKGSIEQFEKDLAAAVQSYDKALQLEPNNPLSSELRGIAATVRKRL